MRNRPAPGLPDGARRRPLAGRSPITPGPDRRLTAAGLAWRAVRVRWVVFSRAYRFGDCEVDLTLYELRRAGVCLSVEPQVLDVLVHLIRHRDRVVTRRVLDVVWGDRFVSESALTSRIKTARRTVGDDGRLQGVIRTVHAHGYRFVAEVAENDLEAPSSSAATDATTRVSSSVTPSWQCSGLASTEPSRSGAARSSSWRVRRASARPRSCEPSSPVPKPTDGPACWSAAATTWSRRRVLGPLRDMAEAAGDDFAFAWRPAPSTPTPSAPFSGFSDGGRRLWWSRISTGPTTPPSTPCAPWHRSAAPPSTVVLVLTYRRRTSRRTMPSEGCSECHRPAEGEAGWSRAPTPAGVAALAEGAVDPIELHSVTKGNPFFVTEVLLSSPGARCRPPSAMRCSHAFRA